LTEFEYTLRIYRRAKAAQALKIGWPFWVGIGAGGVAVLGLLFSKKS
jgi:hypothetical protein